MSYVLMRACVRACVRVCVRVCVPAFVQLRLAGWALAVLLLPLASTFSPNLAAQHARLTLRGVPGRRCELAAARRGAQVQMMAVPQGLVLAAAATAGMTFEAQAPPLGTSLAVLGSTGGVLAYWWLVLVPSERRDLAKNKNKVRALT
jgi:hypothetical protein